MVTAGNPFEPLSAEDLLHRIQSGQWEALRELYQRYSAGVYQLGRRRLNDERAAEEVVQDVFLRVWYHAKRWDPARGSVDAWIFVIARHVVYDYLRQVKSRPDLSRFDYAINEIADPDDDIREFLDVESMNAMLSSLSREQALVVRLIYVDGLSTTAVAKRLNIPVGTVKSRMRLALDHLRKHLEMEEHSDGTL